MRHRGSLLLALLAALSLAACGSALPTATLAWRVAPPAQGGATATPPAPTGTTVAAAAVATGTPAPPTVAPAPPPGTVPRATAATPVAPRSSPAAGPPVWAEVSRWQATTVTITDPFVVRGPWRICWHLSAATEPFSLMVGEVTAGTWEILNGTTGAALGRFDLAKGGTYQLMLHNTIPYTVIVQDAPSSGLPPSALSQPCP